MNTVNAVLKLGAAVLCCAIFGLAPAAAQGTYPNRPIRLIVPFQAGGGTDKVARVLGLRLQHKFGQPVVIENKGGAATNLGMAAVAKAEPDGYTLLLAATPYAINQSLFHKLPFDPAALVPVTLVGLTPAIVVVSPSLPIKTLGEFIAYARANPGKLSFSSAGNGSSTHLAGEMFAGAAGIKVTHIPYKGGAQALTDVIGGQVQFSFSSILSGISLVQSGRLRAIAISSPRRSEALPDVPTVAEAGLSGFDVAGWYGLLAPAGTPAPIISMLASELRTALNEPAFAQQFSSEGLEVVGTTPEEFEAFLQKDVAKWAAVVKKAGIASE